jgi:hypothetical protein
MKQTIILVAFCLTTFFSFGQTSNRDCKSFKFGDFIKDNSQDSIYILRDFSSWYEMNIQKGFRNIFTIIWADDCNFLLVFKHCSAKDKSLYTYHEGDTLSYKTVSISKTGITFSVTYKTKTYQQTLSRQNGLDVWEFMLTRDFELKKDSSFNSGIERSFPDSFRKELPKLKQQLKKGIFNQTEVEQVEYILSLLKQSDIRPINAIASDDFKNLVPSVALADYNEYLRNTYGKLESYSVFSGPVSMDFGNLFGGMTLNNVRKYVLNATFEKAKGNVQITVGLKYDSIYKIQTLNVLSDKTTTLPFIQTLTKDFWSKLNDKEFKKIYDGSAQLFKNKTSYEQVNNMLALIEGYGQLDFYKFSAQNFSIDEGKGFILARYLLDKDNKKATISLIYLNEDGTYKLAGLKYNQK